MKKHLPLFIVLLIIALLTVYGAQAQPVANAVRNDGYSTTLQNTNLGLMPLGADAKGRVGSNTFLQSRTSVAPTVASGTPVPAIGDKVGRQVMALQQFRENIRVAPQITVTTTSETTLIAAGGAGVYNDISLIACLNTSATPVRVDIRDVTAGTVLFSIYLPAGDMRGYMDPVLIPQTSANNNWTIQLASGVTSVRCWAKYIINS